MTSNEETIFQSILRVYQGRAHIRTKETVVARFIWEMNHPILQKHIRNDDIWQSYQIRVGKKKKKQNVVFQISFEHYYKYAHDYVSLSISWISVLFVRKSDDHYWIRANEHPREFCSMKTSTYNNVTLTSIQNRWQSDQSSLSFHQSLSVVRSCTIFSIPCPHT